MSKILEMWDEIKNFPIDSEWHLHLSHNDADGYACFVISALTLETSEYKDSEAGIVMQNLLQILMKKKAIPSEIIITDLSFNENEEEISIFEELLEIYNNSIGCSFMLIDHHKTALWMSERYPEVCFVEVAEGKSAARLYYDKCCDLLIMKQSWKDNVEEYVRRVSYYDTWFWKNLQDEPGIYEEEMILSSRYITHYYIKHTIDKIMSNIPYQSTEYDMAIINRYRMERDKSIQKAVDEITTINILQYKVDVVVGNINASSLMELWGKDHPESICGVLYPHTRVLSLRTQRDDIDVGEICKQFGGGGHPKAAGSVLEPELFCKFLQEYYGVLYN